MAQRTETAAPIARVLADELRDHIVGEFDDETIVRCIRRALEDLSGSVSADALPEMAARLAAHRLTQPTSGVDE